MRPRPVFWMFLFLATASPAVSIGIAQDKAGKDPVAAVDNSEGAADRIRALEPWIESIRGEWGVPGLSVAVVLDDQVVLCKGFGTREEGSNDLVDGDTLFAIASNSKAFTAAALAILVDEGKVRWNDPVHKYLPWLRLSDPMATEDLRVRDLLCHRSGLGTFSGDLLWWGTPYTPRQILERAVHLKPEHPFRGGYGYSNLMFLAAGEVIEVASGMTWHAFVQSRLLTPLAMERTCVTVRDLPSRGNAATPHKTYPDRSVPIPWVNWDSMGAAGGIISSASDMSQWLRLQLRQGKRSDNTALFSPANAYEMWQPQTIIPISQARSQRNPTNHFRAYGLGWSLSDYQGVKLVGHGGGYDGMYSEVLMVPERKLGVVVLTNSMTSIGNAITNTIVDRTLGITDRDWSKEQLDQFRKSRVDFQQRIAKAITPAVTGTQPSHPMESYAGRFTCPMYGDAEVEWKDDKLRFRLLPNPELTGTLEHLHYDTFVIRWDRTYSWFEAGKVHFIADAKGSFVRIEMDVPNDDLWFHELQLTRKK